MPNKTAASDTDTVFQSGRRYANGRNKGMLRITLYGILFFLVILYGISFVPRSSRERAMRSAFVKEKHAAALDEIEIENAGEKASLYKKKRYVVRLIGRGGFSRRKCESFGTHTTSNKDSQIVYNFRQ